MGEEVSVQADIAESLYTLILNLSCFYRYNSNRLSKILTEKASTQKSDGMKKMTEFKYLPIGLPKAFKFATPNYSKLKMKHSHSLQYQVTPKEMNFHAVELCVPMYKNMTLKNNDNIKNIEIASITSESSQISIDHDSSHPILIRPGKKLTVKITVTAEVKGKNLGYEDALLETSKIFNSISSEFTF